MAIQIESLAVKYRPRSILHLLGQDHVVSSLKGMLKTDKFPSAILLTGDSGTGKTTTSRIIARSVNCRNLDKKTFEPCMECQPCRLGESSPDYSEMNIGDSRGIDAMRELIQAAAVMPTISNNRVIVLDETHALTAQAANAILKILEEPPKRTLWILATTNPEKLLPTIVGRCHKLKLDVIPREVMTKQLLSIAKQEGVRIKDIEDYESVLNMICDLSNGRMRDSISLLEAVIYGIKSGDNITASKLVKQFSLTSDADIEKQAANILIALMEGNLKAVISSIRKAKDARALVSKCRWIIAYYLDNLSGDAKYVPYGARVLSKLMKEKDMKLKLPVLVKTQYLLLEAEERFNRMSIDEVVILQATLGNYIASER